MRPSDLAVTFIEANLSRPDHQSWVLDMLNGYAMDDMGDGKPLSADVSRELIPGLRAHPTTVILFACKEGPGGHLPVGIAICFLGFSTFAARPLLNIHDFFILPEYRGQNLGRRLLEAVEEKACQMGCCKLTLEVLENNLPARQLYASLGFGQATYVPEAGAALFCVKSL